MVASILYSCVMSDIQSAVCVDACLQEFTQNLPSEDEWSQFSTTTLDPGRTNKTFLFPSLRFTCNGTLKALQFPTEIRGNASRHWASNLTTEVSIWRPGHGVEGYYLIASKEIFHPTAHGESCTAIDITAVYRYSIKAEFDSITILKNDIVGIKFHGTDNNCGTKYLPVLLKQTGSSVALSVENREDGTVYTPAGFQLPIMRVTFTPSTTTEGKNRLTVP